MPRAHRIAREDAEKISSSRGNDLKRDDSSGVAPMDFDVPATVVCALCGDPDCLGCTEDRSRSGVISIVAWERPGPALPRLWWTAKAASMNAEAFFESLPDGPVAPALMFAVVAELCAASSMLLMLAGGTALALLAFGLFPDGASLSFIFRGLLLAIVGLTTLLVGAHATHGFALDVGARRAPAPPPPGQWRRALRFGLYAAGWDLVLGPVGFFVLLFRDGPKAAFGILDVARRLPTRSSIAFLRGAYRVEEARAKPALTASYVGAAFATIACAMIIVAAVVYAILR